MCESVEFHTHEIANGAGVLNFYKSGIAECVRVLNFHTHEIANGAGALNFHKSGIDECARFLNFLKEICQILKGISEGNLQNPSGTVRNS